MLASQDRPHTSFMENDDFVAEEQAIVKRDQRPSGVGLSSKNGVFSTITGSELRKTKTAFGSVGIKQLKQSKSVGRNTLTAKVNTMKGLTAEERISRHR